MDSHYRRINRNMITGWLIIVAVLLVTYVGEVLKGERTVAYLLTFIPVVVVPALIMLVIFFKKPDLNLCYPFVGGYFIMYLFVMFTGSTTMVFSYILPMLALLVLYHHPKLILTAGAAALVVNLISIYQHYLSGSLTLSNSKDAEIQIALIALCFGGCYLAARLYDDITRQNAEYLRVLNEKNAQIQEMTMRTIQRLARTLDAKDSYTEGHSERVSAYAVQIAKGLGLPDAEIENIRMVALLHDIGKIGVPDSVLNKPGRLTSEEFDVMKNHTVAGSEIIKDIDMIPNVAIGARSHHERYDGNGYPDHLRGADIPYIARIIAIADAYDAMTSNRVYRQHLTNEQVFTEIQNGIGTQFDPVIARTMLDMLSADQFRNLSPDMADEATAS